MAGSDVTCQTTGHSLADYGCQRLHHWTLEFYCRSLENLPAAAGAPPASWRSETTNIL
ncbi:hypothetical protein L484_012371 [Morus notabilis]|uniref:Uncharacterized protein n=1 Tax=Morus notabilis TaxID=981085 RepID=W9SMS3_9ROSA|nr:hypothetical protein L484_012371 [Morus notabilis]